ncbi:MAG: hypothetical protein IPH13_11520 [Planctomycetes bacterium]|nr:hypothetical protein [Planctomycetota bacterium]MCC7169000.1 hypothetical protein [Planctomycetota bacterium]
MTTSSACVLFLLTICGSASAADGTTVPLEPKAYRTFELLLPQERFAEVGAGFAVPHGGSERFTTTLEGDRLRVDLDGDGTCEALVEGETGFVTLARTATDGRSLAYSARLKREPGEPWTYSCGSAMVGQIDGVAIQVFDQNLNGRFDDYGVDAMIVGKSIVASYLSKVVAIGDRLVSIEVAADGSSLDVAPFTGATGTLDLRSGFTCKAKLDAAIVRSTDGAYSFDAARAKAGMKVPAGEYRLEAGRIVLGESRATVRAGHAKPLVVAADAKLEVAWGGPVTAEFAAQRDGDQIGFTPWDIWYYGRLGEEYVDFMPLGASPTFAIKPRTAPEPILWVKFPGNC